MKRQIWLMVRFFLLAMRYVSVPCVVVGAIIAETQVFWSNHARPPSPPPRLPLLLTRVYQFSSAELFALTRTLTHIMLFLRCHKKFSLALQFFESEFSSNIFLFELFVFVEKWYRLCHTHAQHTLILTLTLEPSDDGWGMALAKRIAMLWLSLPSRCDPIDTFAQTQARTHTQTLKCRRASRMEMRRTSRIPFVCHWISIN